MSGARYGRLPANHYADARFSGLSATDLLLTTYLRSNPHSNASGCYRLPLAYVSEDLRLPFETVAEGFRNLCERGFIVYDPLTAWVLVVDHLDVCPVDNPNQGKLIAKLFAEVPQKASVYGPFIQILRTHPKNLPKGFIDGLESVSEPLPTPYPYPYPYPELKTNTPLPPSQGAIVEISVEKSKELEEPLLLASDPNGQLGRIAFGCAANSVHDALLISVPTAVREREGWGANDWEDFGFGDLGFEQADVVNGHLEVKLSCRDPELTMRGLEKYKSRWNLALGKSFGCPVTVKLRAA